MDLAYASLGSTSGEKQGEGIHEISTHFDETEIGLNGDLGSVESLDIESVEKVSNFYENGSGINGSCAEEAENLAAIETLGEENGEGIEIKKVVEMPVQNIESPSGVENIGGIEIEKIVEVPVQEIGCPSGVEDVGSRCRTEEEKVETPEKTAHKVEIIGSFAEESGYLGSEERGGSATPRQSDRQEIKDDKALEKSMGTIGSPSASGGCGGQPTLKGYGLKKWRRIRRDASKDGGSGGDPNRALKRGLTTGEAPITQNLSGDHKLKSESSVASVYSAAKNLMFPSVPTGVSDSDCRLALGNTFPAGTDSENSEDRSSKSSTAASAPKSGQALPAVSGFVKEKNKAKNFTGRSSSSTVHSAQHGKGKVETSKKLRGDRIRIEKENSYSSVESDLRSSNAIFSHSFVPVSNGRQSERSSNYDAENSDDAQVSEPQSSEEVRTAYYKDNDEEVGDVSREDLAADVSGMGKTDDCKDHRPHTDCDPLAESIVLLQAAQDALEKEILEFGDVRKQITSPPNDISGGLDLSGKFGVDRRADVSNSTNQVHFEETAGSSSPPKSIQLTELSQKANLLEHLLEEELSALKVKESEVHKLKSLLNGTQMPKERTGNNLEYIQDTLKEVEIEAEDILQKKIEAEIEYLIITSSTQKLKVMSEDRITLLEEKKSLAKEQAQVLKLKEAENKATMLKKQVTELEASCEELLRTEEVLKVKNSVCKFVLFSFIQLILLCIFLGLLLLQLFPHSTGVAPT